MNDHHLDYITTFIKKDTLLQSDTHFTQYVSYETIPHFCFHICHPKVLLAMNLNFNQGQI
jgi:hypothetical protein